MKKFWVSWYHNYEAMGGFELHSPWWVSGEDMEGQHTICAAIQAEDESAAVRTVSGSYDNPPMYVMWRFVKEQPNDWSPFNGRFPRADWMKWDG